MNACRKCDTEQAGPIAEPCWNCGGPVEPVRSFAERDWTSRGAMRRMPPKHVWQPARKAAA